MYMKIIKNNYTYFLTKRNHRAISIHNLVTVYTVQKMNPYAWTFPPNVYYIFVPRCVVIWHNKECLSS